jgi:D-alanine-D-alanine ligase-like ATP-grasp enzyme
MPTVTILFGGRSVEWRASCQGYDHLREVLREEASRDIDVAAVVLIAPDGTIRIDKPDSLDALPVATHLLRHGRTISAVECMTALIDSGGIVFSLMQAQDGEDGTFHGLARFFDFPDNRSSTLTSALAFDLYAQAAVVEQIAGDLLRLVPSILANIAEPDDAFDMARQRFGATPVVLRPNATGAGFQVRALPFVTHDEVARFAAEISPYDDHFLIQQCVSGVPLSVGVVFREGKWTLLPICAGVGVTRSDGVTMGARGLNAGILVKRSVMLSRRGVRPEPGRWGPGVDRRVGAMRVVDIDADAITLPVAPPLSDAVLRRVEMAARRLAKTFRDESYYQIDMIATAMDEVYFSAISTRPSLRRDGPFAWMLKAAGMTLADLIRIEHRNYAASRAFRRQRVARIAEWVAVHG